ncbi:MAG: DUF4340 domain-containing protein [Thermostichales cyanobacterium BF4_bins_65]
MLKRNTLVLALVALALVAGVLLYDRVAPPTSEQPTAAVALSPAEVTQIQVNQVQLQRQGSQWQIQSPLQVLADINTVNDLLRAASELKPLATLEGISNFQEFGLDPARTTVTLTLADGSQRTIRVGSPTFDRSAAYARVGDGEVLTIAVTDEYALTPDLLRLRDRQLLRFEPGEVTEISLRGKGRTPAIRVKRNDGQWLVNGNLLGDDRRIEAWLDTLQTATASDFVSEEKGDPNQLKTYSLNQPDLSLTLTADRPLTLQLAKNALEELHAVSSDQPGIMSVPLRLLSDLAVTVNDLRFKHFTRFDSADLAEIQIQAQDASLSRNLTPVPNSDQWIISDQPDRQVLLTGLLDPLRTGEAIEFLPANKANSTLKQPQLTLKLIPRPDRDPQPLTLAFAPDPRDPGRVYVRSTEQPDILVMPGAQYEELLAVIRALQPVETAQP